MAEAPRPPAPLAAEASSSAAAPRGLPLTLHLPPSSNGSRGLGSGGARAASRRAAGSGERGRVRKKGRVPGSSAGAGARGDRLVDAVRVVGRDVDAGVAGADILELAMAKGPMFSWLSYWPEEGYPKEDHPY